MSTFTLTKYVCVLALLVFLGSTAHAAPCTDASLIGAYGFQEQGQAPGEGFKEFRSVGVLTFDGHGTGSRTSTIWYSNLSVAFETPFQVTYTVNSNCTFSLAYAINGEVFTGVIVNGGLEFLYLETSGDPMRSGQAEKIKAVQN